MTGPDTDHTDREQRLGEAVFACLQDLESGRRPDPGRLRALYPDLADELLDYLAGREQFEHLARPLRDVARAAESVADPDQTVAEVPTGAAPPVPPVGGYELLEEIGRGGMGVVFKARQRDLNRVVALKMVHATSGQAEAQRFRTEAELAACLDHPHIVPVHEVLEHHGQFCLSMKLLEGGSLAQRLDSFRDDPRAAAGLVATVARAVHHAHQRGVLHRDLKPSNILLDEAGRPYVTDFGLARRVETDSALTQTGAVLGTPSYMPPEQASGERKALTTAADVYGLGALLYALLTGRPPFRGETMLDTLAQVREREPDPPGRLNRRVDRDLETVCLKCLRKEPASRYPSAEALADDLERWLKGEPILARPVGRLERLGRWCRRNPVVAGLSAAVALLLVLSVVGLSAAYLQLRSAWQAEAAQRRAADENAHDAREQAAEAGRQRRRADDQRRRADDNFQKAVGMVNQLLAQANDNKLPNTPEVARLRQAHSEEALRFFQALLVQNRTDPAGRFQTALAYQGLGRAHSGRQEYPQAARAYASSLAVLRQLAAEFPGERRYAESQKTLGHAGDSLLGFSLNHGQTCAGDGRHADAVNVYRAGLHAAEALAPVLEPVGAGGREGFGATRLAESLWVLGQPRQAEQACARALAAYDRLLTAHRANVYVTYFVGAKAQVHALRGRIRAEAGRLKEAESDYRQAFDLIGGLPPREQAVAIEFAFRDRARARSELGNVLWAAGRRRDAADAFRAAEREWRRSPPGNVLRARELAWFLTTCPDPQFRGKPKEAVKLAEKAARGRKPKEVETWRTLGVARYRAGDWKGAAESLQEALKLRPIDAPARFFLAMARWQAGQKEQARRDYEQAVKWADRNEPKNDDLRRFRAEAAELLKPDEPPPAGKERAVRE
jgi:tetratricopeptide (TPR) repeat protein/tRNA A-37 threonylcarbamoyl transferase component Bud32